MTQDSPVRVAQGGFLSLLVHVSTHTRPVFNGYHFAVLFWGCGPQLAYQLLRLTSWRRPLQPGRHYCSQVTQINGPGGFLLLSGALQHLAVDCITRSSLNHLFNIRKKLPFSATPYLSVHHVDFREADWSCIGGRLA